MKRQKKSRLGRIHIAVIVLTLFIVFPIVLNAVYKTDLQDNIVVDSSEESIYVYTGGELRIQRCAVCHVREKADELASLLLPVPESSACNLEPLSDNIKTLSLVDKNSREYILVEFTETYKSADSFSFSLSYILKGQYIADAIDNSCSFEYTAGDYSGAYVNTMKLSWNAYGVVRENSERTENGKFVWESCPGRETALAEVVYSLAEFNSHVYKNALYGYAEELIMPYYIIVLCFFATAAAAISVFIVVRFRRKKLYLNGRGVCIE